MFLLHGAGKAYPNGLKGISLVICPLCQSSYTLGFPCPLRIMIPVSLTSKIVQGYHVQITARSDGDLTPERIIQKVADSSGAKYSSGAEPPATVPRPPIASKPVFTPTRTDGVNTSAPVTNIRRTAASRQDGVDDNGWGPDAPPVTRTQLEKVQPAYKPTKVNIQELRSERQTGAEAKIGHAAEERGDTVKGGYQPVGKVDIAAIRRQALEAGELKEDRPEPVKGAYEPVGKVDIAAIRSRAQKPNDLDVTSGEPTRSPAVDQSPTVSERSAVFTTSERLTSLPKPKVSNKFGVSSAFTGTKPPLPGEFGSKPASAAVQIGSASRTFADQGGKTPAQLWAERKARERGSSGTLSSPPSIGMEPPIQSQHSGQGEWKSSYSGKHWAPVQTTPTGKSVGSVTSQKHADLAVDERSEGESQTPHQSVSALRDQFARGTPKAPSSFQENAVTAPSTDRTIPVPGLPTGPTEPEYQSDAQQVVPTPPQQPRSPTPPTPQAPEEVPQAREASPIRVAMPVGRGIADAHDEQHSPPAAMPVQTLQQAVPDETDLEETSHDIGRAAAEATVTDNHQEGGAIRALVQYDYEKAEDNEIALKEGEYVTEIEMVDKDWWLGVNASGERGLFPSNYVEVVENSQQDQPTSTVVTHDLEPSAPVPAAEVPAPSVPVTATKTNAPTATALYDYEAAEDNEISFPEGAKIANIVR